MKTLFGKRYTDRCGEYETVRKYYKSDRYETLCDVINDKITDFSKEGFANKSDIEDNLSNFPHCGVQYHLTEVQLVIEKMKHEKMILHVRKYLLLGDEDWIYEHLSKFDDKVHSGFILEVLSFLRENLGDISDIDYDFTEKLTKRRKKNIKNECSIEELEESILELMKNKKIVL